MKNSLKINITEAKEYIYQLHIRDLIYHFEDGAQECLGQFLTKEECDSIEKTIAAIYDADLDWEGSVCPIGYALELQQGANNF